MDAEALGPAQRFAGQLDDDAPVGRLSHAAIAPPSPRSTVAVARGRRQRLPAAAATSAAKSASRLLDALAERVAHEAGDLDRPADLAFGFLERLRDASCRSSWMKAARAGRLPCRRSSGRTRRSCRSSFGLSLLRGTCRRARPSRARPPAGSRPARIERLRIGGGDMHRDWRPSATSSSALPVDSSAPARRSCRARR